MTNNPNVKCGARHKIMDITELTGSEQRVWNLFQEGKTKKEICELLGMKRVSVDARIRTAREKIEANAYS